MCITFKINGVTNDVIRLRLFPFSVKEKAQLWLASLPSESIKTWDQLKQAFLHKYFPPHKTAKFYNEITTFKKNGSEIIYSAWERFKELQRQCPYHGLSDWMIPQIFYNGLTNENRNIVNAASDRKWMDKMAREAVNLLEELSS